MSRDRWIMSSMYVGVQMVLAAGVALLVGVPFDTVAVPLVSGALIAAVAATDIILRARRSPRTSSPAALPERESPEEPVDACEHRDARAVPVEVDMSGNGRREVVGWLCEECGERVSTLGARRRNGEKVTSGAQELRALQLRDLDADLLAVSTENRDLFERNADMLRAEAALAARCRLVTPLLDPPPSDVFGLKPKSAEHDLRPVVTDAVTALIISTPSIVEVERVLGRGETFEVYSHASDVPVRVYEV